MHFLTDEKYFKTTESKIFYNIPTEALESIRYGPQNCSDMEEIFNKEIMEEESVIAIASNNTAPSPTGLKFNMIKKSPKNSNESSSHHYATSSQQRMSLFRGNGNGCV